MLKSNSKSAPYIAVFLVDLKMFQKMIDPLSPEKFCFESQDASGGMYAV